jgi:hypothetical protein
MDLHPLHPAAWVIEQTRAAGLEVLDLLTFTPRQHPPPGQPQSPAPGGAQSRLRQQPRAR